jgi:hypothetical protein
MIFMTGPVIVQPAQDLMSPQHAADPSQQVQQELQQETQQQMQPEGVEQGQSDSPEPDQQQDDDDDGWVQFLHYTFDTAAKDIVNKGVMPITGGSSRRRGAPDRFHTWTVQRGTEEWPPPSAAQIQEMALFIKPQLRERYQTSEPGSSDTAAMVYIMLPVAVVETLEDSGLLVYGPFIDASQPRSGFTESVFYPESFSLINQYRSRWYWQSKGKL